MPDLQITVSDDSEAFVRQQAAAEGFANVSDYVESLIELQRKATARQRVDALLKEGLASGPGTEATPQYWQQKKEELTRKFQRADKP
jgi:antitoxin ParD1/3/4